MEVEYIPVCMDAELKKEPHIKCRAKDWWRNRPRDPET